MDGKKHGVQEMALGVRAYRQQMIASNIANADTPGYKAVDIDVEEAMRIARSASQVSPTMLATTSSGHISGMAVSRPAAPYALKYQVPSQDSADGNTVDMDVERTKFSDNSIMYQFSVDRVSGHFKMLMELYQSLK
jgi:flagellar basal-body rod protein FlgB